MTKALPTILPPEANIPKEWIVSEDGFETKIAFPSWSRSGRTYHVTLHKFTRELSCGCEGHTFNGVCHHVRGVRWACYGKKKSKRKGVTDTSMDSIHMFSPEELARSQLRVFNTLCKDGPQCIREIAESLEVPEKCVTGRLMEVRQMGVVDNVGEKMDMVTNRRVKLWGVV